jgi:hypothetical protein
MKSITRKALDNVPTLRSESILSSSIPNRYCSSPELSDLGTRWAAERSFVDLFVPKESAAELLVDAAETGCSRPPQ